MDQGQKLLFVCSQNRLRSLTAEHMYRGFPGYAVRSVGTSPKARVRVNEGHIGWADLMVYLFRFFAGFCLIANGVYIGIGWLLADGADPWVMTQNGSPVWLLVLFGLLTAPSGLFLWHPQGPHFGLSAAKGVVNTKAAAIAAALFLLLVMAELIRNQK